MNTILPSRFWVVLMTQLLVIGVVGVATSFGQTKTVAPLPDLQRQIETARADLKSTHAQLRQTNPWLWQRLRKMYGVERDGTLKISTPPIGEAKP